MKPKWRGKWRHIKVYSSPCYCSSASDKS